MTSENSLSLGRLRLPANSLPAHVAEAFVLRREVAPVGAIREHQKVVTLNALLVGGGVMTPRSLDMASRSEVRWRERIVEVSEVDEVDEVDEVKGHRFPRVVEAVFLSSRSNDPFVSGSALLPDGVSGRRFRVSVAGSGKRVEALDGLSLHGEDGEDDELVRRVTREVRGLGEAPLFWAFCPPGEVLPNTPMPLDSASASAWFGHDPSFEVEHASATFVGLADLEDTVPRRVALFAGAVSFRSSNRGQPGFAGSAHSGPSQGRNRLPTSSPMPASATSRLHSALSGWIGVDPATGERVAAELSGPVQLEVTAPAVGFTHAMSGQGTLSISTRSRLLIDGREA